MKRKALFLICGLLVLILTGCFKIEQEIDLSSSQSGHLVTKLWVNEQFASAEMDLFLDQLHMTLPAMGASSEFSRYEKSEDLQDWIVYEWNADNARPISELPLSLTKHEDDSYEFRYEIRPFEGFSAQTESDTVMMTIRVTLPKDVDFANTMNTIGPIAEWDLRKADLMKGVTLRAITK